MTGAEKGERAHRRRAWEALRGAWKLTSAFTSAAALLTTAMAGGSAT